MAKEMQLPDVAEFLGERTVSGYDVGTQNTWEFVMRMLQNFGECLEGLKLTRARGFNKIELYIDSQVIVKTLTVVNKETPDGWTLVQNIRRLIAME
ncbi:hypothetical protein A2U01_0043207 [Trifolium medium]|uniref:RNase H type-1 domain-containing protein n=1 Tax=Trifolium medium TaxID=97028 RepID=A0A392QCD4_9FABA|nr:hypothetical protein [Trifolium medium]